MFFPGLSKSNHPTPCAVVPHQTSFSSWKLTTSIFAAEKMPLHKRRSLPLPGQTILWGSSPLWAPLQSNFIQSSLLQTLAAEPQQQANPNHSSTHIQRQPKDYNRIRISHRKHWIMGRKFEKQECPFQMNQECKIRKMLFTKNRVSQNKLMEWYNELERKQLTKWLTEWLLHASLLSSWSPRLVMQQREGWRREDKEGGVREEASVNERLPLMSLFSLSLHCLVIHKTVSSVKWPTARLYFSDE